MNIQFAPNITRTVVLLSVLVIAVSLSSIGDSNFNICKVRAAETSDFCYRTPITFKNSYSSTIESIPGRVVVPASSMVSANQMNKNGWDIYTTNSSSQEQEVFAQDMTGGETTSFWIVSNYAPSNSETPLQMYTGSNKSYRDQGFWFSHKTVGAYTNTDTITIADHADFDLTDNVVIIVDLEASTSTQNALILDKYNTSTNSGYDLVMTDSGTVAWGVGNGASKSTLATSFDGTETIKVMFSSNEANDMQISYLIDDEWVLQAQQNSGFTALGTNNNNILLGQQYDGLMKDLIIGSCVSFFCNLEPTILARWGFNPQDTTQTSAVSPTFTGLILPTVRNHNATYSMYRPISMEFLSSSIGATAFSSANPFYGYTPPIAKTIGGIGEGFAPDTTTPAYASIGIMGEAVEMAALGTSFNREAFLFGIMFILTSIVSISVWLWTKNELIVGLLYIVFMSVGATIDMFNMWYAIIFGLAIISILMLRVRLQT